MKILVVNRNDRYKRIVRELRKRHDVDYVWRGERFRIHENDFSVHKLFGRDKGNRLLMFLVVHFLLLKNRYDICLTDQRSTYMPFFFILFKKVCGIPGTRFIQDVRTIPVEYPDSQAAGVEGNFRRRLVFASRFFQGMTFITDEMKAHIEEKYLHITSPNCVWESGVDVDRFHSMNRDEEIRKRFGFGDDDFVCFYHGLIAENRGVLELVRAFQILQEKEKRINLLILGKGSASQKVESLVKDLDLKSCVKTHAWTEYENVPRFISIADLCIVPLPNLTWWNVSSPLKLMEYIASGKNILMSNIVAHRNVVGGNNGYFFFDEVNESVFSDKILEAYLLFIADPERYRQRGWKQGEQLKDGISWARRAAVLEDFLALNFLNHLRSK